MDSGPLSEHESLQREHYDSISAQYAAHYGDQWSQCYRNRFTNARLFAGIDLRGLKVLDALCGSGETTEYLLAQGAHVTGVDISPSEMARFQSRYPQAVAHCASVLATGLPSESFDLVTVMGGLHHVHPDTSAAVAEIHRVLKPGGWFCFHEPHAGSLPDLLRKLWYRCDPLFASNEAAIDLPALQREFATRFNFVSEWYGGNLAYLLVLNSLIFRVPVGWKRFYARPLMFLERLIEPLQGRRLSCIVVCQWRKRGPDHEPAAGAGSATGVASSSA